MAGMAWQTTHVAKTHKNAFPYNATKTFQQPLVGQKWKTKTIRWSQIHAKACHKNIIKQEHSNNLWLDRSEKTNNVYWSKAMHRIAQIHNYHKTGNTM